MDDLTIRMLQLAHQGYACSQVMILLALEACGRSNPDLVRCMAGPAYGKRDTGTAQKPDDRWATPLCRQHHDEQHKGSEAAFWAAQGIDPFVLSLTLWGCSGDDEAAEAAIKGARK